MSNLHPLFKQIMSSFKMPESPSAVSDTIFFDWNIPSEHVYGANPGLYVTVTLELLKESKLHCIHEISFKPQTFIAIKDPVLLMKDLMAHCERMAGKSQEETGYVLREDAAYDDLRRSNYY